MLSISRINLSNQGQLIHNQFFSKLQVKWVALSRINFKEVNGLINSVERSCD